MTIITEISLDWIFRHFIEMHSGAVSEECVALLKSFADAPTPDSMSTILESTEIDALLQRYEQFCDQTHQGQHGSTARFWLLYVDQANIFLLFDRACRTNDVSLYTYALGLMCPMFFATHKPNYARWISLYHLNLLNMETTHPGIRTNFEAGALSVRRTRHSFSRSTVDITLEQTVNKDAASRQKGMACFTQNIGARKR